MDPTRLKPIAFIATVQPYLVIWVMTISFFVTLSLIAMISKGRKWWELSCLFFLAYGVITVAALLGTGLVLDITLVDIEVITPPVPAETYR